MIIVLNNGISPGEKDALRSFLSEKGFQVREIAGENKTVLGAVGSVSMDIREVQLLPGVASVIPISKPYKMASREFRSEDSVVEVGPVKIGGSRIVVMAGPCAVESRQQILETAWAVREAGGVILRGGAFKPRSSPYSFQGLGMKGLEYLKAAGEETGLPVVSEVVSPGDVAAMSTLVDLFQIGTRNMQNFELLKAVGASGMPVILKRGMAATVEEWLMAAEYLLSSGTDQVILCERGIRTFGRATRNTLDISAIPVVRELSHLPVIVDPSHATGLRDKVPPMALASVAAGAHGLIVEVHTNPDKSFSDGPQSLWPCQFETLVRDVEALCPTVGREMARLPGKHHGNLFGNSAVLAASASAAAANGALQDGSGGGPEGALKNSLDGGPKGGPESGPEGAAGVKKFRVAFQGVRGAYSERAVNHFFPEGQSEPLALPTFNDVFQAVLADPGVWGVLPVENSLAGGVLDSYDLFSLYPDVKIVGEIKVRIRHNVLAPKGMSLEKVRKVFSHPQALAQCDRYITRRGWEAVPFFDTAGAAAMVASSDDSGIAAIASREAARCYNLDVLAEDVETNPRNYTRFMVIAHVKVPEPEGADKTSFEFVMKNHPGSLSECLAVLKKFGIDMTYLESRPIHGRPWSYRFFADAFLPEDRAVFDEVEKAFRETAEEYHNLGKYRSA